MKCHRVATWREAIRVRHAKNEDEAQRFEAFSRRQLWARETIESQSPAHPHQEIDQAETPFARDHEH
jgi:hypothetical protein